MYDALERWLRQSAARVHEQAATLTALDQAIGDGDHGINLDRGFTAILAQLDAAPPDDAEGDIARSGALLRTAGRTLISKVGGASGPLYGTAFLRASGVLTAADPDIAPGDALLSALDAAIGGIGGLGKATSGEKTMLDALVPALHAGEAAREAGADVAGIVAAVATAAETGATATIPLLATKGRASYLGERSIGHQDPGATSAALLLRSLADAISAG